MNRKINADTDYDVVVLGAGVVGSAAAFALANKGAKCLLLEANPKAVRRYAGEWMHPPVVDLMKGFGLEIPEAAKGHRAGEGFVVFPEDGSAAIELPYPEGARGFCCSHEALSVAVREQAIAHPNVEYVESARAVDVQVDGRVRYHLAETSQDREVRGGLVVGAGGRSCVSRQALGSTVPRDVVSYMAALALDVELPREGFGHVFMGGPGAALGYRTSPDEVRVCLDVPADRSDLRHDRRRLYAAFESALPESLRAPTRDAIDSGAIKWSATFFQPRTERGRGQIALVGDAIGLCHPLCAAGVVVGFLDVALLTEAWAAGDLAAYRRRGAAETRVPELMSCAIYQLLGTEQGGELRQHVYHSWRTNPAERDRTMRILTGIARDASTFVSTFANIGAQAVAASLFRAPRGDASDGLLARTRALGQWLRWPVASALPNAVAQRIRPHGKIDAPF
jgi:2-polyprenyl-6-methoxyphenol hydroxylase-like FAD-dependent oxidoreductase